MVDEEQDNTLPMSIHGILQENGRIFYEDVARLAVQCDVEMFQKVLQVPVLLGAYIRPPSINDDPDLSPTERRSDYQLCFPFLKPSTSTMLLTPFTLGGDSDNDFVLPDPSIHKHHLLFQQGRDGNWALMDTYSGTDVFVNDECYGREWVDLHDG
ncbi:MAG: FHA domain-containing protein, partial [Magnetococcales bacterium]|nr:FHA domain-containing protein [Magnetococcales bacterium]